MCSLFCRSSIMSCLCRPFFGGLARVRPALQPLVAPAPRPNPTLAGSGARIATCHACSVRLTTMCCRCSDSLLTKAACRPDGAHEPSVHATRGNGSCVLHDTRSIAGRQPSAQNAWREFPAHLPEGIARTLRHGLGRWAVPRAVPSGQEGGDRPVAAAARPDNPQGRESPAHRRRALFGRRSDAQSRSRFGCAWPAGLVHRRCGPVTFHHLPSVVLSTPPSPP